MKITGKRQGHLVAAVIKTMISVIVSVAVFVLQLAFYVVLFAGVYSAWYLQLATGLMGFLVVIWLYRKDINPSYKLSWTIVILAMPMAGTLLYFLFGGGRNVPKRKAKKINAYLQPMIAHTHRIGVLEVTDPRGAMLCKGLKDNSNMDAFTHTDTRFFATGAQKHAALLDDLMSATDYVYLEYFIISDGEVLSSIMQVLTERGRAGVRIKFIYDDIGSKKALSRKTKKALAAIPNLELCVYEPATLSINPRINYRDHRKIAVIDGRVAYMGGDNLADEYVGKKILYGHWRDNAMRFEGDAVHSVELLFAEVWFMSCGEKPEVKPYVCHEHIKGDGVVFPFGDGPTNGRLPAYNLFRGLMSAAQKYLYISTPYLIIDNAFISSIKLAAEQGVDVKILVPHIPDKKLVFAMTRGHYGEILKAGGKIYEYTPGFNHAKNVITDDKYAFIGTVNCDYRSMLLHFECGALLVNNSEITKMRDDFLAAVEVSEEITLQKWKKRSLGAKIVEDTLSLLAPLL